jgi:hypothetical protein
MIIRAKNYDNAREILGISAQKADILMLNYHKVINFASCYAIPQVIKVVRGLSLEENCVVTLCAKLSIESDLFYSVVVFDGGLLLGISDSITERGYTQGKALKVYKTTRGDFGVSVGRDFCCAAAENVFSVGAQYILHQSLEDFSKEFYLSSTAHAHFGANFAGLYKDTFLCGRGGRIVCADGEAAEFVPKAADCVRGSGFLKLEVLE